MNKLQKLINLANEQDITLEFSNQMSDDYCGVYCHKTNTIRVSIWDGGPREWLYTLAHELGHAHHKHGKTFYRGKTAAFNKIMKDELDAWNYAIKLAKKFKFDNKYFRKHICQALLNSEIANEWMKS